MIVLARASLAALFGAKTDNYARKDDAWNSKRQERLKHERSYDASVRSGARKQCNSDPWALAVASPLTAAWMKKRAK
jgi:hypothetical protein